MALELRTGELLRPEKRVARFTPNLYWVKSGDTKTLLFNVDGAADVPKVLLHPFVRVTDDSREKGYRNEHFFCRKDPALVESTGGVCPICEKGLRPKETYVAIAVELEAEAGVVRSPQLHAVMNKFQTSNGEDREAVRWGIVMQARRNFWKFFAAQAARLEAQGLSPREVAFDVQRDGEGSDTAYIFYPLQGSEVPDLSQFEDDIPSLEEVLEGMASDEKYELVTEIDPDAQPTFGNADNAPKTNSARPSETTEASPEFDSVRAEFERMKALVEGDQKATAAK